MAITEMPIFGYIWTIILCNLLLPPWCQTSPIPSLVEEPAGFVDPALLDQDDNVDVQALLGQFLYMLNLTEQELAPRPRVPHVQPPEYMLELYNHYANDRTTVPAANIARSLKNEDSSPRSVTSRGVATHPLMFNISIPHDERIIAAELRLYLTVRRDPLWRRSGFGVDWKVTVFEMQGDGVSSPRQKSEGQRGEDVDLIGIQKLASRRGHRKESGWEAFDLTDPVQRWRKSEVTSHWLEVHVECTDDEDVDIDGDAAAASPDLDIERIPEGRHEPVLIVFSDKESDDHNQKRKNQGLMTAKGNNNLASLDGLGVERSDDEKQQDEALLMQMRSNVIYDNAPRTRRNAKGNHCKRTPLYVDFKDIGWDSWVVAPPGFEAYTCHGVCSYPLVPQVTPTKHAIIQTLVNLKSPQRVSQACCVPTKLEPISLLYENELGHVIFQHKYEGMVVAECGCR